MASYSRIYIVYPPADFTDREGRRGGVLQIWVGDGNRQWLEAHWIGTSHPPIARIKAIVPAGPDHPDSLIDACIAFFPDFFRGCPSLTEAELVLNDADRLDFDLGQFNVPLIWTKLREEARPFLAKFSILRGDLEPVE